MVPARRGTGGARVAGQLEDSLPVVEQQDAVEPSGSFCGLLTAGLRATILQANAASQARPNPLSRLSMRSPRSTESSLEMQFRHRGASSSLMRGLHLDGIAPSPTARVSRTGPLQDGDEDLGGAGRGK